MMSEDKNKDKLKNAIQHLPEFDPDEMLWNKIEAELDFAQKVSPVLAELPEFEPADGLWDKLEGGLIKTKKKKDFKIIRLVQYSSAAAACVLIGFMSWKVLNPVQSKEPVTVSYSVERINIVPTVEAEADESEEARQFIKQQCKNLPDVCQSPKVIELKDQLMELEKEERELKENMGKYGADPELIKYQIRIENLKSEVTKELIQIIVS